MCMDNQCNDTEGENKMKQFILNEVKDAVVLDAYKRENDNSVIATRVPDSVGNNEIYFLTGNFINHRYYFTNLCGQALGSKEYDTPQEAISRRIKGEDCDCRETEVYLFKSIKEVIKKLGG